MCLVNTTSEPLQLVRDDYSSSYSSVRRDTGGDMLCVKYLSLEGAEDIPKVLYKGRKLRLNQDGLGFIYPGCLTLILDKVLSLYHPSGSPPSLLIVPRLLESRKLDVADSFLYL